VTDGHGVTATHHEVRAELIAAAHRQSSEDNALASFHIGVDQNALAILRALAKRELREGENRELEIR